MVEVKVKRAFVKPVSKYDLTCTSLYKVFEKYPKDVVDMVLLFYTKDSGRAIQLLRRMYGPKFDGVGAKRNLSFEEKRYLEDLFKRMDEFLAFAMRLINKGVKKEDIKKMFEKKSDADIIQAMKDQKLPSMKQDQFDLQEFLRNNNLTMEQLGNILDYHNNTVERMIFKRKFGINSVKMTDNAICNSMYVDQPMINQSIKNVQNNLPNLLKKAKEEEDKLKEMNYQTGTGKPKEEAKPGVAKQPENRKFAPAPQPAKQQGNTNPIPSPAAKPQNDDKKPAKKDEPDKIIGNRGKEKKFVNYFATHGMEKKELKELEDKMIAVTILLQNSSRVGFDSLKTYFGDDLRQSYTGNITFSKIKYLINLSKQYQDMKLEEIKKALQKTENPKRPKKEKTSKVHDPDKIIGNRGKEKKFVNYFATYGIKEEEMKPLEDKVIEIAFLLKDFYTNGFETLVKYYGEDLRTTYIGKIDRPDFGSFRALIQKISNYQHMKIEDIKKEIEEQKKTKTEKPQKEYDPNQVIGNKTKIKKFVNYFATYGIKEEEMKPLEDKVIEIAFLLKDFYTNGFETLVKYYGEDLRTTYVGKIDRPDFGSFRAFIQKISNYQHMKIEDIKKEIEEQKKARTEKQKKEYNPDEIIGNRKKEKKFIYYFATHGMDEEETKKLEDKVIEIAFLLKDSWNTSFEKMTKYFGNDLRQKFTGSIPLEDRCTLKSFRNQIKEYQTMNMKDIKKDIQKPKHMRKSRKEKPPKDCNPNQIIGNRNADKKLVYYFATHGMDKDKVKALEDKIVITARLYEESNTNYFNILTKYFGEDLRQEYIGLIDPEDRPILKNSINLLRKDLNKPKDAIIGNSKEKKKFINYFITQDMDAKEIKVLEDKVVAIGLLLKKVESRKKEYEITSSYFGEDLRRVYTGKFNSVHSTYMQSFKKHIKKYLPMRMEEIKKALGIQEEPYQLQLEYIDSVIHYQITVNGYTPELLQAEYNIPIDVIIKSCIHNITCYDIKALVEYIVNEHPEYIEKLLKSDYFMPLMEDITLIEKNLIYLKLLSITNKAITTEYIATMLNLPIEDITSYEIFSRDESAEILGLYLK